MPLSTGSDYQADAARRAAQERHATGARARQVQAAVLRDTYGWTWDRIAGQLGYASAGGARAAADVGRTIIDPNAPTPAPRRVRRARPTRRPRAAGRANRSDRPGGEGRCFGVEIEFVGISQLTAATALQSAGLDAAAEGYNHRVSTWAWKIVPDATVSGGEAVSPILRGEAGLQSMRTAMTALRQAGARVDASCGLHVHHDVAEQGDNSLTGDEIARFVEFYATRNDTLDRLVSASRRNRGIGGQHLSDRELVQATTAFRQTGTIREYEAPSRYRSVNVASFPKYGTIEIRQHQGTLNGSKAEAWVRLGWSMIEAVKRNTDTQIGTGLAMLGGLADQSNLPQRTAAFLTSRMESL